MSGQSAVSGDALPRVLVLDDDASCDVFEVVEATDSVIRVRSAYLFELGEELRVRIERGGQVVEATARVRAHVADGAGKITELELDNQGEPRTVVSG